MSQQITVEIEGTYPLPPLILHPFTESASTARVLESAKASLSALKGGSAASGEREDLKRHLLEGRYTEVRMLFYVGKDLFRWLEQCRETCDRENLLRDLGLQHQSFAQLLIRQTPNEVVGKLRSWGVIEYARIFSRSIGIYAQFREPPERSLLQDDYLRHYYRYADYAFACWKEIYKGPVLPGEQFPFTLYASGEYAKMLEREWTDESE
jgi:hypothetical protein